ncbi:MAG: hypothetical protein VKO21_01570 [Candidatus Sericytochromatia bacterium]|nr:hypothetical protein [Candidatus Sericytochromatia bacterium]
MRQIPGTLRLERVRDDWLEALGASQGTLPRNVEGNPYLPSPPWSRILDAELEWWQARCYGLWERLKQVNPAELSNAGAEEYAVLREHLGATLERLYTTTC